MKEQKQIITICCVCDVVTKPESAVGLTGNEVSKLQDVYAISHGCCKPCYEAAKASLEEELSKLPPII